MESKKSSNAMADKARPLIASRFEQSFVHIRKIYKNKLKVFVCTKFCTYICGVKKEVKMTVTNITDFRANAKAYIDAIINDNGTLFINRGTTAAVLISLEEYNSIKATEKALITAGVSDEIELGIEQFRRGERIVVDIDSL